MPLQAGTRLGAYEIVGPLGAGGMGEVYRARDTKLGREVAVKILPDLFASDADRLARFEREAQVLASLNHPNIAAIYGVEDTGPIKALILELVEGETLAERLQSHATGLPLREALPIARQIVDALETAHEKTIVHRDLKPANIALTADNHVKILDFGLAKEMDIARDGGANVTHSPTLTLAATQAGVILGTAAYMSPEQAKGRPADRRSDVWAFGCVLYEMLTGRRAFDGEDVSDTLAAVLRGEPDWNALPKDTPVHIRTLIKRCLERDRRMRTGDISVARFLLTDGDTLVGALGASGITPAVPAAKPSPWARSLPWGIASAAILGAITMLVMWAPWQTAPAPAALRLNVELGADVTVATTPGPPGTSLALSPDGTLLAFVGVQVVGGTTQLFIRRLGQLEATALSGTEGARDPFISPDGQWIGFFTVDKLKKVSVTGGAAITLCDVPGDRGGSWADDDTIVLSFGLGRAGVTDTTLYKVSASGGKPEPLTRFVEGEVTHPWPQMLPGGKAVLYTAHNATNNFDDANIVVQVLPSGPRKMLQRGGYHARYLPSGHIAYIHDGTLFAAPFDLERLETTGPPVPVIEGIASNSGTSGAQFEVSQSGTFVYLPGGTANDALPLHWMSRDGRSTPLRAAPANWSNPSFSPDGKKLAIDIRDASQIDIWVYDWARDTLTRLTFDPGDDFKPVWTPDGQRIVFASTRAEKGRPNLYWQKADGSTSDAQRLTEGPFVDLPSSWHPDGKHFSFSRAEVGPPDLMILPMEGDEASGWKPGKPTVFLRTPAVENEPMFSPDGKWIAYFSNESGPNEVYVRPFPGPGGKWQISTGGGATPTWSPARQELLYRNQATGEVLAVSYTSDGAVFKPEKPQRWFDARITQRPRQRNFNVHPDGQRIAAGTVDAGAALKQDKVVFIFNFGNELERVAPTGKSKR